MNILSTFCFHSYYRNLFCHNPKADGRAQDTSRFWNRIDQKNIPQFRNLVKKNYFPIVNEVP